MQINPRLVAASALVLLPALALTACGTDPINIPSTSEAAPASATTAATTPALAVDVPVLGKVSGDQLAGDDYGVKLMDVSELVGTGLGQAFATAGIDLDPAQHSVVLLALGEQPSGGFSADITALQYKGDTLFVEGTAVAPAQDAATSAQITRPFSAVAIDKVPVGTVVRSDIK